MNLDNKNTFRTDVDSADIFNDGMESLDPIEFETWDDVFCGFFDDPLEEPKNTTMAIRRTLPSYHPQNFTLMEMNIPYLFTTDDKYGDRWMFLLVDLGDMNIDWTFLAIKPNRVSLLEFLSGQQPLTHVYNHTPEDEFYIVRPNVSSRLLRIDPHTEFPQGGLSNPDLFYNDNIFLDMSDPEFGYNTEDAQKVMSFAKAGKFYYKI